MTEPQAQGGCSGQGEGANVDLASLTPLGSRKLKSFPQHLQLVSGKVKTKTQVGVASGPIY